jgi:hypothetical protein
LPGAAGSRLEPPAEILDEHGAVEEPGERIEHADAPQAFLGDGLLGRIGERSGDPVARAARAFWRPPLGTEPAVRAVLVRIRCSCTNVSVWPERCASSAALRPATSSACTRSSQASGRTTPACAGKPSMAHQRPET